MIQDSVAAQFDGRVSLHALKKAGRVLKAFTFMYLPFHELEVDFLFDHAGLFCFLSASLYEADEINEEERGSGEKRLEQVRLFLLNHDLLDECTNQLIEDGARYLKFERAVREGAAYTHNELFWIAFNRSVDFRLMHRVLFRILNKPYDERVFSLYAPFEFVFEIEDDLKSYREDREANTFNIYDLLVRLNRQDAEGQLHALMDRLNQDMECARRGVEKAASDRFARILEWYRLQVSKPEIPKPLESEIRD